MKRSALKRTAFKPRKRRHRDGYHDKRMLDVCRGQPCYLKIKGVCLGASGIDTVVPAHSNQHRHGKGAGIKAKDKYTVPACMSCHSFIDQGSAPKQQKFDIWDKAFDEWLIDRDKLLGGFGDE